MGSARLAEEVIARLVRRADTVGCAESLTGGLVCSALVGVPGASAVVRGAVVAYASDLKASILGVDAGLLERSGAVHPDVAAQMATGIRAVLGATWGVSTTGVAGPAPIEGMPVGTVYVAVAGPRGVRVIPGRYAGDRDAIRRASVDEVLSALCATLRGSPAVPGQTM